MAESGRTSNLNMISTSRNLNAPHVLLLRFNVMSAVNSGNKSLHTSKVQFTSLVYKKEKNKIVYLEPFHVMNLAFSVIVS